MTVEKRKIITSLLLYVPFFLILYILQVTVFTELTLFGVKPLVLPVAVVGVAVFEGSVRGGVSGLFAGMLCDLSFNQPTVQFTLILTVIGIAIGLLCDTVMARGFPSYIAITFVSLLVVSFAQFFGLLFFNDTAIMPLIDTTLRQTVYSLIIAVPVYYFVRGISRHTKS